MTDAASRADAGHQRSSRNRRIRELKDQGWSYEAIGNEVGLTKQRIEQILSSPTLKDLIAAKKHALRAERSVLHHASGICRSRLRAIDRQLARLEEEEEARAIDRLLGLG
jgi:orotate phosphoribosyltransferase-like protein